MRLPSAFGRDSHGLIAVMEAARIYVEAQTFGWKVSKRAKRQATVKVAKVLMEIRRASR